MTEFDIRKWALRGAEQRLVEIAEEASRIYAAFPELRDREPAMGSAIPSARRQAGGRKHAGAEPAEGTGSAKGARKRRVTLSPEAKARIAEAQRKRWAEWREKNGGQSSTAAAPRGRKAKKR